VIPEELFWESGPGARRPDYNRVLAEVMRRRLVLANHKASLALEDLYGELAPELDALQQAADLEAARRRVEGPPRFPHSPSSPPGRAATTRPITPRPRISTQADLDQVASEARGFLPPTTAQKFTSYLKAAAPSPSALRVGIDTYLAQLPEARATFENIDYSLAVRLAEVSHALVDATSDAPPPARSLAAAAVAYFVDSSDEEHDLLSPIGFYDDAVVLGFVVRTLELPIPVPVPSKVPGIDT
jgi:uncharacterized membrane protein YkvA (DUF1232 family)